ncbi:hypothetical protein AVEN_200828-2-1, partial [Araneus ventricosus]
DLALFYHFDPATLIHQMLCAGNENGLLRSPPNGLQQIDGESPVLFIGPHIHGGSSIESGFEPGTIRPRSRNLITRQPRSPFERKNQ